MAARRAPQTTCLVSPGLPQLRHHHLSCTAVLPAWAFPPSLPSPAVRTRLCESEHGTGRPLPNTEVTHSPSESRQGAHLVPTFPSLWAVPAHGPCVPTSFPSGEWASSLFAEEPACSLLWPAGVPAGSPGRVANCCVVDLRVVLFGGGKGVTGLFYALCLVFLPGGQPSVGCHGVCSPRTSEKGLPAVY